MYPDTSTSFAGKSPPEKRTFYHINKNRGPFATERRGNHYIVNVRNEPWQDYSAC
jgi:hypothetical protein